jgi:hypothetical protein
VVERRDGHNRREPVELPPRDGVPLCREQHRLPRPARTRQQRAIGRDRAVPGKRLVPPASEGGEDIGRMPRHHIEMRPDRGEGDDRSFRHRADDGEDVGLDSGEGVGAGHGAAAYRDALHDRQWRAQLRRT